MRRFVGDVKYEESHRNKATKNWRRTTSAEYFDKTQLIGGLSGLANAVAVPGAVGDGEQHAEAERHPLEPTEPGLGRRLLLWLW